MGEALTHVFRFKQPDRGSVYPTIFIGVGGAGGMMVERIVDKLSQRWDKDKYDSLCHAFVLDTDMQALNGYRHIPQDNRVLLSDFNKGWYMSGKRGDSYVDADPFVTDWVHPWYRFRDASGDGAGQIRLESRLSLHHQLEQDRGGIIRAFQRAISRALHHDNPYRCAAPARFNVHVFCSVAGGTGSGIFLSLAYLWRRLLRDVNHEAKVFGYLMLPGPFFGNVPHVQEREIDANGYAALKELEHLMALGIEGQFARDAETFHYSGFHKDEREVRAAPFNFVYLLDDPSRFAAANLREYRDAVADAMFVQFFSPVFGEQQSGWDNMIKLVNSGSCQGYVLNYGAYGATAVILPARDLLGYCAHRYALDGLDRFLLQRAGAGPGGEDFAVRTDTDEWLRLSDAARAERLDDAFVGLVGHLAHQEERAGTDGGLWQAIAAQRSQTTDGALRDALDAQVAELVSGLSAQIGLTRVTTRTIATHDHDVLARREQLKQDLTRSRNAVGAAWGRVRLDIENGAFLRRFFDDHRLNPLAQRFFLIHLGRDLKDQLTRLEEELRARGQNLDLDDESRTAEFESHNKRLAETAPLTLWERLRKENKDFNDARSSFVDWMNRALVGEWTETLRRECEHRVVSALVKRVEALLQTFRDLVGQGQALRQRLEAECAHILRDGALQAGTAEVNQFAFDIEVLRDEATGRRLWDRFYDRRVATNHAYFAPSEILPALNAAFDPERDAHGGLRQPDVETIGRRIVDNLRALGERRLRPVLLGSEELSRDRSQLGLLIDDGLDLEARFVLGFGAGALSEPDQAAVDAYIDRKLAHAQRKADVLCTIAPPAPDAAIHEDAFTMACGHPVYKGELLGRFENALRCKVNTNWDDPRTVLLYSARLGIPLFWVRSVNERMKPAYRAVQEQKVAKRAYPLHIDHAWETRLDDLDPVERREAKERAEVDDDHVRFAFCRIADAVVRDEGGTWRVKIGGFERALGATLPKALDEFKALRADVAQRLDGELREIRAELEGPHEPASEWAPVATYLREVSDACLSLPEGNILHTHRAVMSAYFRRYAPPEALAEVEALLAPLPPG